MGLLRSSQVCLSSSLNQAEGAIFGRLGGVCVCLFGLAIVGAWVQAGGSAKQLNDFTPTSHLLSLQFQEQRLFLRALPDF